MKWEETRFGVKWGPVEMQRCLSFDREGFVVIRILSKNKYVDLRIMKGGKIVVGNIGKIKKNGKRIIP